jgi:hypothetical protein
VRLAWAVPGDLQTFQSAKVVLIPHRPGELQKQQQVLEQLRVQIEIQRSRIEALERQNP